MNNVYNLETVIKNHLINLIQNSFSNIIITSFDSSYNRTKFLDIPLYIQAKFDLISCLDALSQHNSFKNFITKNNCLYWLFSRHPWAPICSHLFSALLLSCEVELSRLRHTSFIDHWLLFGFGKWNASAKDPKVESERHWYTFPSYSLPVFTFWQWLHPAGAMASIRWPLFYRLLTRFPQTRSFRTILMVRTVIPWSLTTLFGSLNWFTFL